MTNPSPGLQSEIEPPRPWLHRVAGALAHRNFRIVWFAALGSTIGTWMQNFAQSWLVFDLTQSNFYKGVDDFLGQLPILLFMLIGGVIADRHDRRKLLTGSQYVQAFSAFTLAALLFWHRVTIWHIFALSFITGCGQAFGGPAYQSMIPSLVPRRDLPNAIALNSTQFNLSRVLGPVAGNVVLVGDRRGGVLRAERPVVLHRRHRAGVAAAAAARDRQDAPGDRRGSEERAGLRPRRAG